MDRKDRQILHALQSDGRLTNQDLSKKVNLSPSPCLRRVRALEDAGIIRGYTALVDQKACGLSLTAFIRIRLAPHTREAVKAFEQAVTRLDEVIDCYLMSGQVDYLLRIVTADLDAYEDFMRNKLHAVPSIAAIDTSFAYGVLKQSRTYPLL